MNARPPASPSACDILSFIYVLTYRRDSAAVDIQSVRQRDVRMQRNAVFHHVFRQRVQVSQDAGQVHSTLAQM